MSAQKGVLHTRVNGEERSQNPVVTSQNPESGGWRWEGWNLSSHLTLISIQQQPPQCFPRSRFSDVRFNRKHEHVMCSHAGQQRDRTPRPLRPGRRPRGPTGQVRTGQNRSRQGREEQGSFVTSPSRCCQLASSWVVGRSEKTCHWSRLPYLATDTILLFSLHPPTTVCRPCIRKFFLQVV